MKLDQMLEVTRAACNYGGPGPLSTGEALTAALVLNRADWLREMGYTIAQAIWRIDSDSLEHLREAASQIEYEIESGSLQIPAVRSDDA